MKEAGSKWMRMRPSLPGGSQTMQLLIVPSVIHSFGLPIENITAGIHYYIGFCCNLVNADASWGFSLLITEVEGGYFGMFDLEVGMV